MHKKYDIINLQVKILRALDTLRRHIMKIEEFLKSSLTAYHATENCEKILLKNGFKKLNIRDGWNLVQGGKYFVVKNQSSIIAFVVGDLSDYYFNIAGAHTDSPSLRVKGEKLVESPEGKRINVETYGSLIHHSFFDIPLKIAGRVFVDENNTIVGKLVESEENVNIPSLAFHQNRNVNDGVKFSVQNDLLPLAGDAENVYSFFDLKNIIDADLFVVPNVEPFYSGLSSEYLCSPRLDNLVSAWAAITSLCKCRPKGVSVACCFDNEEIGSLTKQGADSSLLPNVLEKINIALNRSKTDFIAACEKGMILSIDNAHAVHPAHSEKSDPAIKVQMGKGLLIKHHTNYSTDGYSSAKIKSMLKENRIDYQDFYCNSDLRCGSTLALFSSSLLSMNSCDVGLPQLAMHSAIETMMKRDIDCLQKCCDAFYNTAFDCNN